MTSISARSSAEAPNDGEFNWRVWMAIISIVGGCSGVFWVGVGYGGVRDTADKLEKHLETGERQYLRKDGNELAEIKGDLRLLNEKVDNIDRLLRQAAR